MKTNLPQQWLVVPGVHEQPGEEHLLTSTKSPTS